MYKNVRRHLEWLPRDLTIEEKQVLEEEEIMMRYYNSLRALGESR